MGLEEGIVEALSFISIKDSDNNDSDYKISASELEQFCKDKGFLPATRLAARIISKLDQKSLLWYLTCAQNQDYKKHNRFKEIFGKDYQYLIDNMNILYGFETEERDDPETEKAIIAETEQIIDNNLNEKTL